MMSDEQQRKRQRLHAFKDALDAHAEDASIICMRNSFDLLNDDLVALVFARVGTGVDCLRTLAPVCKRFSSLMHHPEIWRKTINLGQFTEPEKLDQVDNPDTSLLPYAGITPAIFLASKLFAFPVASLYAPEKLATIFFCLPFSALARLRSCLTSLTLLMSDALCPAEVIADFSRLTDLALSYTPATKFGPESRPANTDRYFAYNHALTRLGCLQSVVLSEVLISHATLKQILEQNPVKYLSFTLALSVYRFLLPADIENGEDADAIDEEFKRQVTGHSAPYLEAISKARYLISLNLSWFYCFEYTLQDSMCLSSLTTLLNLNIHPNNITGETLAMLLTNLPNLQCFSSSAISPPFPKSFSGSTSLCALRSQGRDRRISEAGFNKLAQLLRGLPSLIKLFIEPQAFIGHEDFDPQNWPKLAVLRLVSDDFEVLTEKMVENLAALPSLDWVLVDSNGFVPDTYAAYDWLTKLTNIGALEFQRGVNSEFEGEFGQYFTRLKNALPNCDISNHSSSTCHC